MLPDVPVLHCAGIRFHNEVLVQLRLPPLVLPVTCKPGGELQAAVLRCTSLSAAHALEALEKSGQN